MRQLIISADDLGLNTQRSHGIFIAAEHGIITNVSLIANGSDSDSAAKHAMERKIPTGIHLNLTTGTPLSKDGHIQSLLTTDGFFLGRENLRRKLMENEIEPEHIEREVRAQIEWFLEHRGQPTHVDSHHHMHVHPFVAQNITSILDRYGVNFVRIPEEPTKPFGFEINPKQSQYIEIISIEANAARDFFSAHGIQSTDNFRGLAFAGNASMRTMRHILGRLPEGTTEWMTHPGSPNPNAEIFDADPQRQTELNILLSDDTRAEIASREIELCSYEDLF